MTAARAFVDRPVGDVAGAAQLAGQYAVELRLPAPIPVRTGMNALFRSADTVIRVGRPNADPRLGLALGEALSAAGIAVPRPFSSHVAVGGGLAATSWEWIEPVAVPLDWRAIGAMVRATHGLPAGVVPDGYPVPSPSAFPWWHFEAMLADTRPEIDDRAWEALRACVERNAGWADFDPKRAVVCHGDLHPGNVMMSARGPVLLDWDLMCRAPTGWDHAALITWADRWGGDPALYATFATGYGARLDDDPQTRGFAELRNVAATLMRVQAGRADVAARAEAERRLRFWRGDPDAPQWTAQ